MANAWTTISITGGTSAPARVITTGDTAIVSRLRFQVFAEATVAFDVRGAVGSGADLTYVDMVYTNVGTGAEVAAGTDIDSNGIYEVDCSGLTIAFLATTGTAQVRYVVLLG